MRMTGVNEPTRLTLPESALDEETARAEVYGLLAQLFYQPPVPAVLAQIRVAVTEAPMPGAFLEESWRQLVAVTRAMDDQAVRDEFDALFGGLGKPEVYLFGSHYLSGFLNEKPLVRLRDDLSALGLQRVETMPETEDHIAYLCEVMRYLIAGDDAGVANLTQQRRFFLAHLRPWLASMCDALGGHRHAKFYASLAAFVAAFGNVESQGFDMLDDAPNAE